MKDLPQAPSAFAVASALAPRLWGRCDGEGGKGRSLLPSQSGGPNFLVGFELCGQVRFSRMNQKLDLGIDPNLQNQHGWTILMLAAMHGKSDMAELMLAYGADPTLRNKFGDVAAELAILKGHKKTERMVELQPQPYAEDRTG